MGGWSAARQGGWCGRSGGPTAPGVHCMRMCQRALGPSAWGGDPRQARRGQISVHAREALSRMASNGQHGRMRAVQPSHRASPIAGVMRPIGLAAAFGRRSWLCLQAVSLQLLAQVRPRRGEATGGVSCRRDVPCTAARHAGKSRRRPHPPRDKAGPPHRGPWHTPRRPRAAPWSATARPCAATWTSAKASA